MAEKYTYTSDVSSLLNIIINSVYSNKDVFVRELLSNCSDSYTKLSIHNIKNKPKHTYEQRIDLLPDKENKQLFFIDNGIGMKRDDLINNIGTIAHSNTKEFIESMQKDVANQTIGSYGLGMYSVFLVASKVCIYTRYPDGDYYRWESDANISGEYSIEMVQKGGELDEEGNEIGYRIHEDYVLKQGCAIQIYLNDDSHKYLELDTLRSIIKTHSQFINYPIYYFDKREESKEIEVDVEDEEEKKEENVKEGEEDKKEEDVKEGEEDKKEEDVKEGEEDKKEDDEVVIEDVVEDDNNKEEEKPKKIKKTITEVVKEYILINEVKSIWNKNPKDITDDEYKAFYKSFSNDNSDPLAWRHIKGEGNVEYSGIIYIPRTLVSNVFERQVKQKNVRLYVKNVFVTDDSEHLCPEWLSFVSGVINVPDLNMTISREMLQTNNTIKVLRKAIVKKSIDLLKTSMNDDKLYKQIYNTYSKNIKLGCYEETADRERVGDLLMYYSMKFPDKMITLDEYITNMPEKQKDIYFISGEDKEILKTSPFLERFDKNGYDVLYFIDSVDEYIVQRLTMYKENNFTCITKGNVELPNITDKEKEEYKKYEEEYKELCNFIKKQYKEFTDVKISSKVDELPCAVCSPEFGFSANMERIVKAQTLGDTKSTTYMLNKRVLELNPTHKIIKSIKDIKEDDNKKRDLLDLMINSALLYSGYPINKPVDYSKKVIKMVMIGLEIDEDEEVNDNNNDTEIETVDVSTVD